MSAKSLPAAEVTPGMVIDIEKYPEGDPRNEYLVVERHTVAAMVYLDINSIHIQRWSVTVVRDDDPVKVLGRMKVEPLDV